MLSAVVLVSILSLFSVTQYNKHKTKSLVKEAKIQLGHLYRMQATYRVEHNTFTFELEGNMFPKGQLIYNVGFGQHTEDWKANPCAQRTTNNSKNNYYELCGDTDEEEREECWFENKKTEEGPSLSEHKGLNARAYRTPNHNCSLTNRPYPLSSTLDHSEYCLNNKLIKHFYDHDNKSYTKFVAYASGDILDPHSFSSSSTDELDTWRINGNGFLEHCNNPLDDSTSNTCHSHPMKKIEGSGDDYCD